MDNVMTRLVELREAIPGEERSMIVQAILDEHPQGDIAKASGRSRERIRMVFQEWATEHGHRCAPHKSHRMTCGAYERLRARSTDHCECCGVAPEETKAGYLVIDHEQGTTRVRGLVCHSCNSKVGAGDCWLKHPLLRGNRPHTPQELEYLALPAF